MSKYLKCSVWRLAVRYDMYVYVYIYIYVVRRQRVNILTKRYSQNTLKNKSEHAIHGKCQFLHVSAPEFHLRESTGTEERKSDTLIQVVIALTVGCWLIYGIRE